MRTNGGFRTAQPGPQRQDSDSLPTALPPGGRDAREDEWGSGVESERDTATAASPGCKGGDGLRDRPQRGRSSAAGKVGRLGVGLALALSLTLFAVPAGAQGGGGSWGGSPNDASHWTCDFFTCKVWLNWNDTFRIHNRLNGSHGGSTGTGATGAGGLICGVLGTPILGGICALSVAVSYSYTAETFREAVESKSCVTVKMWKVPATIASYGTYRGAWCK